jgi:hypothetical protein
MFSHLGDLFGTQVARWDRNDEVLVCGGCPMKISRWWLVALLLGLMSSAAMADGVDPQVKLIGGGTSTGLFSLNDPNFSFTVYGGTSPQNFDFINATGQLVGEVDLLVSLLAQTPALTFTVDPSNPYFTNATVTTLDTGQTLIRFFGLNTGELGYGGLPFATDLPSPDSCDGVHSCFTNTPGADFIVQFADNPGTTDLSTLPSTEGFNVVGTLVAAPEPSTMLLVLVGVAMLALLKKPGLGSL